MIPSLISILVFFSSNIFVFQFDIVEVLAAPVIDQVGVMLQLAKYGYTKIPEDMIKGGYRFMRDEMAEALMAYQKFHKLQETGKVDRQTVNQMQQPRCGVPDIFPDHLKRYKIYGTRWNKKHVVYQIMNNLEDKSYQVPFSAVESDFSRALNLWQPYIPIQLQLSNHPRFDPDVPVSFESGAYGLSGQTFDGPEGVLATTYYPPGNPSPYYIPSMTFDSAEAWYFENERYGPPGYVGGKSFYQVATHELGHSLGLQHSSDKNAIMYAYYKSGVSDHYFSLTLDDIEGIRAVYYNR